MPRVLFAALVLCFAQRLPAAQVLLPNVTALAYGPSQSVWATEVRVTNLTSEFKRFSVVDWIGSPGWRPKTWQVAPGQSLSISGYDIFRDATLSGPSDPLPLPIFGAAIADAEPGLLIQIAILTGIGPTGGVGEFVFCEPWNGGYIGEGGFFGPCGEVGPCNDGAGPVLDATDFFVPDARLLLPWLNTDASRRTNVAFINPDSRPSTVVLSVFPADGQSPAAFTLQVPPHSIHQLNDVFANAWSSIRARNEANRATAARVVVTSDTRLYALSYVISNLNNTVSLGSPRPLP